MAALALPLHPLSKTQYNHALLYYKTQSNQRAFARTPPTPRNMRVNLLVGFCGDSFTALKQLHRKRRSSEAVVDVHDRHARGARVQHGK